MAAETFPDWLRRQGAEVMAPTNPYEMARFRARGGVHVVYVDKRQRVTASGIAGEAYDHWRRGERWSPGITKKPRTALTRLRAAIAERDGIVCFYCGKPMPADDMTIEHLVSRDKGGPDHLDNLVLAHGGCNRLADNLPLVRKVELRERMRKEPA